MNYNYHPKAKILPVAAKYAVLYTLLNTISMIVLFVLEDEQNFWVGMTFLLVLMPMTIIIGIKDFRDNHLDRRISFGKGFQFGMVTALLMWLFWSVYFLIHTGLISTDYMQQILLTTEEYLYNMGLSDDQIERTMERQSKQTAFSTAAWGVLNYLFFGAIFSSIGAAILKKD